MTSRNWLPHLRRLTLISGTLLACWGLLVWVGGHRLANARIDALIQEQSTLVNEHADALRYNFHRSLAFLHALPSHFAADDDVQRALGTSEGTLPASLDVEAKATALRANPHLMVLSRQLATESKRFGVDVTWIVNAAGDCIVASNYDQPGSFLGTNYHDRDYFTMPMANQPGHQFAVGRVTGIPLTGPSIQHIRIKISRAVISGVEQ